MLLLFNVIPLPLTPKGILTNIPSNTVIILGLIIFSNELKPYPYRFNLHGVLGWLFPSASAMSTSFSGLLSENYRRNKKKCMLLLYFIFKKRNSHIFKLLLKLRSVRKGRASLSSLLQCIWMERNHTTAWQTSRFVKNTVHKKLSPPVAILLLFYCCLDMRFISLRRSVKNVLPTSPW